MAPRLLIGIVAAAATIGLWPVGASAGVEVRPAIIGGEAATAGSWPAMAGLRMHLTNGTVTYLRRCGGTLIAPTVVLTAAHCLDDVDEDASVDPPIVFDPPLAVDVPLSTATIGGGSYGSSPVAWSSVSIHGQYANLDYDIALIGLSASSGATPMPLLPSWRDGQLVDGVLLDAAGYGQTAEGPSGTQPTSSALLQTQLPYVGNATCARFYGAFITARMLCAGYRGAQATNICFGDSGGPLALPVDGTRLLVGNSSFVWSGCWTAVPAGFGRISAFRSWILDAANGPEHVAVRNWLSTQTAEASLSVESAGPEVTLRWSATPANWTTSGFTTVINEVPATSTDATMTRTVSIPQGGLVTASVTPIVGVGASGPATFAGTPTPTRAPVVSAMLAGTARAGAPLTASAASDDPWGSAPTLQWTWNDEPISGATGASYTPTRAQMGGRIGVVATASNAVGSATGSARASALVIARPRTAVSTTATLGTPSVGQRLRVTAPSATGYPQPRVTYQWLRDGRAIKGATSSRYRLRSIDRGRSLRCRITYANSAGKATLKSRAVRVR